MTVETTPAEHGAGRRAAGQDDRVRAVNALAEAGPTPVLAALPGARPPAVAAAAP